MLLLTMHKVPVYKVTVLPLFILQKSKLFQGFLWWHLFKNGQRNVTTPSILKCHFVIFHVLFECVILWHFCHPTPIKSYVLFECPLRRIFFDEFLFLYTPLFGLKKKTRTAIYVSKSDKKSRKSEKPLFASFFLVLPGLFIVDFVSISYYLPDINKKYFRISNYNNSFLD